MAGAIRFIPQQANSPFVSIVNHSTPAVYDLYQTIPQLNSYQTFMPQPVQYGNLHQNSQLMLPQSDLKLNHRQSNPNINGGGSPFSMDNHIMHNIMPRREEAPNGNRVYNRGEPSPAPGPNTFNRRDGWGNHGHGGGNNGVGKSPAISALALLGFLFFLNLIQQSLQNNRQMLTTTTTTTVTTNTSSSNSMTSGGTTVVGGVGRDGRVRRRRGFGYEELRLTPFPIPTHPNRQIEKFLQNKDDGPEVALSDFQQMKRSNNFIRKSSHEGQLLQKRQASQNNEMELHKNIGTNNSFFQKIKRLSVGCMQLMACRMGRTLIAEMEPSTGFMLRMLGRSFLPVSRDKRTFTSRMAKALSYGWNTRHDCNKIFRQCSFKNPTRRTFRRRAMNRSDNGFKIF